MRYDRAMDVTYVTELTLRASFPLSDETLLEAQEWLLSIPYVDSVDIHIEGKAVEAYVLIISHQSVEAIMEANLNVLRDARSSLFLHDVDVLLPA